MEESIPLLSQLMARDGTGEGEESSSSRWWSGLAREAGKVGYMALPMAAVSVAQYAVQVASNMMVGHLPGVLPLSASAIATSLASVSGFSLLSERAMERVFSETLSEKESLMSDGTAAV